VPEPVPASQQVRFGVYEANLRTGELTKHGRRLRIAGRPFQILALLLERPGELVTREEIQSKLWTEDTFVDFEHGVNSAIRSLRSALCDSHKKPRFIETLPRRGYRFIADLDAPAAIAQPAAANRAPAAAITETAPFADASSEWVGRAGAVASDTGANHVLLPIDEAILEEMRGCEKAGDDLGISLLVADEKLLMVACGTKFKILEAPDPAEGFRVRILGGHFIGQKAFLPRKYLGCLDEESSAATS
jgi:DNA-binding winged helix-turn-helix (wHTH) protein